MNISRRGLFGMLVISFFAGAVLMAVDDALHEDAHPIGGAVVQSQAAITGGTEIPECGPDISLSQHPCVVKNGGSIVVNYIGSGGGGNNSSGGAGGGPMTSFGTGGGGVGPSPCSGNACDALGKSLVAK